jgi:26S proteasome regulatory subunit N1
MAPKDKQEAGTVDVTSGSSSQPPSKANKKKDGDAVPNETALSEEDRDLKERLETCVATLMDKDDPKVTVELRLTALQVLVTELRTATSSMTSVPKPLKFLRPHYPSLKAYYYGTLRKNKHKEEKGAASASAASALTDDQLKLRARLADVLAVLAMTMATSDRESLAYKLESAADYRVLKDERSVPNGGLEPGDDNLGSWGHEFVRSLAGEIGEEYSARVLEGADPNAGKKDGGESGGDAHDTAAADDDDDNSGSSKNNFHDLMDMVAKIVPFHVTHNAEAEAIDLLIEVQRLKQYLLDLPQIDSNNYQRICLYLIKTADYMSDPDDYTVRQFVRLVTAWPFFF